MRQAELYKLAFGQFLFEILLPEKVMKNSTNVPIHILAIDCGKSSPVRIAGNSSGINLVGSLNNITDANSGRSLPGMALRPRRTR